MKMRDREVSVISDNGQVAALVKSAVKGEKQAFVALVDLFRQTMFATAMAVSHNEDDAMDAVQDTILILWEKLDTLRNPEVFKTWMIRILLNRCFARLRGKKWEVPTEDPEEVMQDEMYPEWDTSLDVQNAMKQLSENDRLVLQLFYFEDMSVREIAQALSIRPEAVRMRLARSRSRFRQQYETEVCCKT